MGRPLRTAPADLVYHVLNRANGQMTLFEHEDDYAAFTRVLAQACERYQMRLVAYCAMPNHWHLVVWPRRDGDLSRFMNWLTLTHTQRWHQHRQSVGQGHVYQGRFKSFPVETDEYLLTVCRYVERNALRAQLVDRAEQWRWGSAWQHAHGAGEVPLSAGPIQRPSDWIDWINEEESASDVAAVRQSVTKSQPFGSDEWVAQMVAQWNLASTLRGRGRPRKESVGNGS